MAAAGAAGFGRPRQDGNVSGVKLRMRQSIARALDDAMAADPTVILMGEDVAVAEGPFKTSEGLLDEFGAAASATRRSPRWASCGAAVGAAATGLRPVVEIMFVEFLGVALDQVVTEAAKLRYLSGGAYTAPLVVRASVGAGLGFGTAALADARDVDVRHAGPQGRRRLGRQTAPTACCAPRSRIPTRSCVLEPRALYGEREEVDFGDDGSSPRRGLASCGAATTSRSSPSARRSASPWPRPDGAAVDADVIDLRTLVPWDRSTRVRVGGTHGTARPRRGEPVRRRVGHRHRRPRGRPSASAPCKAPIVRITSPDVPVPFPAHLEQQYLPSVADVQAGITELLATGRRPTPWWEREGYAS